MGTAPCIHIFRVGIGMYEILLGFVGLVILAFGKHVHITKNVILHFICLFAIIHIYRVLE